MAKKRRTKKRRRRASIRRKQAKGVKVTQRKTTLAGEREKERGVRQEREQQKEDFKKDLARTGAGTIIALGILVASYLLLLHLPSFPN